jgi:hypothetical protein
MFNLWRFNLNLIIYPKFNLILSFRLTFRFNLGLA